MAAFRVEYPNGAIAHLVMDDPERRVNVFDEAAFDSLEAALGALEARAGLAGVIVRSGKSGSFIAGADAFEAMELGFPDHRPDDGNGHPLPRGRTNAEALAHARAFLAYAIGRGHRGTPHKL